VQILGILEADYKRRDARHKTTASPTFWSKTVYSLWYQEPWSLGCSTSDFCVIHEKVWYH